VQGGGGGEVSKTEGTRRAGLLPSSVFISPPGTHWGPPTQYPSSVLTHLPILTHTQACITDQQEVEFLDKIQTKVLRVFLFVIHSYLYSFARDFYFCKLTQPLTVSLKEKGGKPDRKPFPLPFGLSNPYRSLKSENCQDYAQKPQQNFTFMNSASVSFLLLLSQNPLSGGHQDQFTTQYWYLQNGDKLYQTLQYGSSTVPTKSAAIF
jgi:hypothetical protein